MNYCSFCGSDENNADMMLKGDNATICGTCIRLSAIILASDCRRKQAAKQIKQQPFFGDKND